MSITFGITINSSQTSSLTSPPHAPLSISFSLLHPKCDCDEWDVLAVKPVNSSNRMLLGVDHHVDDYNIYNLLTTPEDAANWSTTTILQLKLKLMVKGKVLTLAQDFSSTNHNPVTTAILTFFRGFWYYIQMLAEDIPLTLMRKMYVTDRRNSYSMRGFKTL